MVYTSILLFVGSKKQLMYIDFCSRAQFYFIDILLFVVTFSLQANFMRLLIFRILDDTNVGYKTTLMFIPSNILRKNYLHMSVFTFNDRLGKFLFLFSTKISIHFLIQTVSVSCY